MAKHQVPQMVVHLPHQPADRHKVHGNDPNRVLHRPATRRAAAAHRIGINGPADHPAHHRMVSIHHIEHRRVVRIPVATIDAAAAVDLHIIHHRINHRRHRRVDIIREMMTTIGIKSRMLGNQHHATEANLQLLRDSMQMTTGIRWQMPGRLRLHQRVPRHAMLMTKIKRLFIRAVKVHVRYEVHHEPIHHHGQ